VRPNEDPHDVPARFHERVDRGDEALEVKLVEQRLPVGKAWREKDSNDTFEHGFAQEQLQTQIHV
jgi:hypothetical protein